MHYIVHLKIAGETTSHVCQSAAEAIDEMAVAAGIPDGTVEIWDFLAISSMPTASCGRRGARRAPTRDL